MLRSGSALRPWYSCAFLCWPLSWLSENHYYPGPCVPALELTEWSCYHENWNQWDSCGVWNIISLLKEYIWSAVVEEHIRSVLPGCSAGLYSAFSRLSFQCQYLSTFPRASSTCCKIFIDEDYSFSRTRTGWFHIYDQTHLVWGHLISVTQFV